MPSGASRALAFGRSLLFDWRAYPYLTLLLLALEAALGALLLLRSACAPVARATYATPRTQAILRCACLPPARPCCLPASTRSLTHPPHTLRCTLATRAASTPLQRPSPLAGQRSGGGYVNVDWQAYMEQVTQWRGGESDYARLRGGTGPLVYPAGFLHLFAGLQALAGGDGGAAGGLRGAPLLRVQAAFLGAYLLTLWLALRTLRVALGGSGSGSGSGAPARPWLALLLVLSYRLHSLYTLRLFNDCWSALCVFGAVALLGQRRWLAGALLWSAGVGVKMHGLLLLPALGLVLLRNAGPLRAALCLAAAAALQGVLALPFLAAPAPAPAHYLARAFQLGRESRVGGVEAERTQGFFLHLWSVNWGFLPSSVFVAPRFGSALLAAHLAALLLLAHAQWCGEEGLWRCLQRCLLFALGRQGAAEASASASSGSSGSASSSSAARKRRASPGPAAPPRALALAQPQPPSAAAQPLNLWRGAYADSERDIVLALLGCNFVGIALARSLHYQFYAWYAASLPVLAWGAAARLPPAARLLALAAIEVGVSYGPHLGGSCVVPGVAARDCAPWQASLLVTGGHLLLLGGMAWGSGRAKGGGAQ